MKRITTVALVAALAVLAYAPLVAAQQPAQLDPTQVTLALALAEATAADREAGVAVQAKGNLEGMKAASRRARCVLVVDKCAVVGGGAYSLKTAVQAVKSTAAAAVDDAAKGAEKVLNATDVAATEQAVGELKKLTEQVLVALK